MPELPEVESSRRSLEPYLLGGRILSERLFRPDVCRWLSNDGLREHNMKAGLKLGDRIVSLRRRGKQMAAVGESGEVLIIQLGMSGRVLVCSEAAPPGKHIHAAWRVQGRDGVERTIYFQDARRFGKLTFLPSEDILHRHVWSALGPDGLDVTGEQLAQRAGQSTRAIKAQLLDQWVVAGVGNIYADEALFAAAIRPTQRGDQVDQASWDRLAGAIRRVLAAAVQRGGSTLKDYVNADGAKGEGLADHKVYGRGGLPCLVCNRILKKDQIGQRTSVWCSSCQVKVKYSRGKSTRVAEPAQQG